MARDHARILVSVWSNSEFRALNTSEQCMYFTLLSQPRLSYCGVLDYLPHRIAQLAADLTPRKVEKHVEKLEAARFVALDSNTGELLIRSFVRHDGLLNSPNMTIAMVRAFDTVLSHTLRDILVTELMKAYTDDPDRKGWSGLRKADPDLYTKVTGKGFLKGSPNGLPERS